MPDAADFAVAANLPPERAIAHFRRKGYAISWDWHDVWERQHAHAFTVAKALKLDLLQDIRGAVDRALAEGRTERQFIAELEPALRRRGWWGRQTRIGPDGSEQAVQLGSHRRLRTIFRTNAATARAASRFEAMTANAEARPYWMYDAMNDSRTRPSHRVLDNRVFRHDDPFWRSHFPPNGWGCRCLVRAFTADQVRARGLKVYRGEGRLREIDQLVDERTGLRRRGIEYVVENPPRGAARRFAPDPGWSYAPGRIGGGPPTAGPSGGDPPWIGLREPALDQRGPEDFGLSGDLPAVSPLAAGRLPRTASTGQAMDRVHAALGWRGVRRPGDERAVIHTVRTPDGLEDVQIDHAFVEHVAADPSRADFANYILPALERPHEVWNTWVRAKNGVLFLRPHFLAAFEDGRTAVIAIQPKEAWIAWTFFTAKEKSVRRHRKGELLYRSGGR